MEAIRKIEHGMLVVPVAMDISVIPWGLTNNVIISSADWHHRSTEYYVVCTRPFKRLPNPHDSQHEPMTAACLIESQARPDSLTGDVNIHTHWVRQRTINGVALGNIHAPCTPDQVKCLDAPHSTLQWSLRRAFIDIRAGKTHPTHLEPRLPRMTLNDFPPTITSAELPSAPLHLAIRLVHHLQPVFARSSDLTLPGDVLMTLDGGKNAHRVLDKTLRERMWAFGMHHREEGGDVLLQLFTRDMCRRWVVDFWVMPQGEGLGKLYAWNGEGALRWFLSKEGVRRGDLRLYVEAHLVPYEEWEESCG